MSGHTPAPWTFDAENGRVHGPSHRHPQSAELGIEMQSNPTVAYIRGYHGEVEANANGNLIAAAPDLLALLEELIDIEGPQPGHAEWARKVQAAIAKARP